MSPKSQSGEPYLRRPIDIAILSFDRPQYLIQVLDSLAPQLTPLDRVCLFQDGAWNPHSGIAKADHKLIEDCLALFSRIIPQGKIIPSAFNLGIAANYRRADDFVFVENGAPYALFLEDDLVLAIHYLKIIDRLLALAQSRPSIGYVSAYGDLWASLESQQAAPGRLQPMHENWGSALTRESWLKQKPIRDAYWELVKSNDYSQRDHAKIRDFYQKLGYDMTISGQDGSSPAPKPISPASQPPPAMGDILARPASTLRRSIIKIANSGSRFFIRTTTISCRPRTRPSRVG